MQIAATVVEQLRLLHEDSADGQDLAEGLSRLSRDVARAVPSSLAVTILLARLDGEVGISALAQPAAVLASLAVPLTAGAPTGLLILRAGVAGAYLLLADDLNGLLGPDHRPVEVDAHLSWPTLNDSLAASLADQASVNRAVGALVDQGLLPEEARHELARRAGSAAGTVAAASRELLDSLRPASHAVPPDGPAADGAPPSDRPRLHGPAGASGRAARRLGPLDSGPDQGRG